MPRPLVTASLAAASVALGLMLAGCETPGGKVSVLSGDTRALVAGSSTPRTPTRPP